MRNKLTITDKTGGGAGLGVDWQVEDCVGGWILGRIFNLKDWQLQVKLDWTFKLRRFKKGWNGRGGAGLALALVMALVWTQQASQQVREKSF